MAAMFETEPCTRCGGSGTYSYCIQWGTTCFACGVRPRERGTGRRLTKRGKAARAYFQSLLPSKRVADLVPGDMVVDSMFFFGAGELLMVRGVKCKVLEVTPTTSSSRSRAGDGEWVYADAEHGYLDIVTDKMLISGVQPDTLKALVPTAEQVATARAAALAYQETLTKTGTPRKSAGAA